MKSNSLIKTNPYLRNAEERKKLVARSVRTSSGVEGIPAKSQREKIEIPRRGNKKIYKSTK